MNKCIDCGQLVIWNSRSEFCKTCFDKQLEKDEIEDNFGVFEQLKTERESLMMAHDHLHKENRELKNRVRTLEEKCNVDDVLPKGPEVSI